MLCWQACAMLWCSVMMQCYGAMSWCSVMMHEEHKQRLPGDAILKTCVAENLQRRAHHSCRDDAYQKSIGADEVPEFVGLRQVSLVMLCQGPLGLLIHADVCFWFWRSYWLFCSSLCHCQSNISWWAQCMACTAVCHFSNARSLQHEYKWSKHSMNLCIG